MRLYQFDRFDNICSMIAAELKTAPEVDVGEWHAQKVPANSPYTTREIQNATVVWDVPASTLALQNSVKPNLPWAEEHFRERVSGKPLNPPPSHEKWPHAEANNDRHTIGGQFSHTYPERFWPRFANTEGNTDTGRQIYVPHVGIRFEYGELSDLVTLLCRNLNTRQAYLPVWFPEDLSAAMQQERVPCTLGYHFLYRDEALHMTYFIRSCDFVRHFRDDFYMAARLLQWVADQVDEADPDWHIRPGQLTMHTTSMHLMAGDIERTL